MRNIVFAILIALLMIGGPIAYKRWHDREFRNFHVVEEGVLYRSGQLPLTRLQQIVKERDIRTVICLREGNKPDDQAEETWIKASGRKFVRIQPPQWFPDAEGKIPGEAALKAFREVMDDPANYPVLVHCYAGYHRTGAMCAAYRIDYQGWSNAEAMAEMRVLGYSILDDHEDVLHYFTNYRPPAEGRRMLALPVKRQID
jgi:tyrosine-protein phosphatase SIW14